MEPRDLIETLNIWRALLHTKFKIWTADDEAVLKVLMNILTTSWVESFLILMENTKNEG